MVNGIASFREQFRDYPDCYTVIGGTACDILMTEADFSFRATKDIDMILILENRKAEFGKVFRDYIRKGGYRCGWKNDGESHFYRFTNPNPGYPVQIELFARKPDYLPKIDFGVIPIHLDDDVSSLSAILLNEDYYRFMLQGRKVVDGVSVLDAPYLIPFKMYAWLDLCAKKANGDHVNEKDLKKHKLDVFRLLMIVPNDAAIPVSGTVAESVRAFLEKISDEPLPFNQIKLPFSVPQALKFLERIYQF